MNVESTTVDDRPTSGTYVGILLATASLAQLHSTLMSVLRVTMWSHHARLTMTLAILGLAAGAVIVQLRRTPTRADLSARWTQASILFAVTMACAFAAQLRLPMTMSFYGVASVVLLAIPFTFAGIALALVAASFPQATRSLYAAGLTGAGTGNLVAIPLLNHIDAPAAVLLGSTIAAAAGIAVVGSRDDDPASSRALRRLACSVTLALALVSAMNTSARWTDVRWTKGRPEAPSLYEAWSAQSRVTVREAESEPAGWGLSPVFNAHLTIPQLRLDVDAAASAVITGFDGYFERLGHLKFDITSLAHVLRTGRSTLVIGVGGGRDVLTALAFGQPEVVAVEPDHAIVDTLRRRFADFSGGLLARPDVRVVEDDARAFLARSPQRFGLIAISLLETWAAHVAGAAGFTENTLFTRQAWAALLRHLDDDGVLTVSRYYADKEPVEALRLTTLTDASLRDLGIANPREHMVLLRTRSPAEGAPAGIVTMLVSRRSFTNDEVKTISAIASPLGFDAFLTPTRADSADFEVITDAARSGQFIATYPLAIAPPTDDWPYFFQFRRGVDALRSGETHVGGVPMLSAMLALLALLAIVVALPLRFPPRTRDASSPLVVVGSAATGLALSLIVQAERTQWAVVLGTQSDSVSVLLFAMLCATSVGAIYAPKSTRWIAFLPPGMLTCLAVSVFAQRGLASAPSWLQVVGACGSLLPLGVLLGMGVSLALSIGRQREAAPVTWYYAIHLTFLVIAAPMSLLMMISWGITATLASGAAAYAIALLSLYLETQRPLSA